ncbi:hypothetical protein KBD18_01890 [Patescibacteria group bacterium]|nr:hypothetical protein [Patescibacteria group bacterium]
MITARPLYRAVLQDALTFTRRNPHLWPLGFLGGAMLTGSAYDLLIRMWNSVLGMAVSYRYGFGFPVAAGRAMHTIRQEHFFDFASRFPWWFPGAIAFVLVFGALVIWLSVVCQGALLDAVAAAEEKKQPNLQTFFRRGMRTFWPILGINILVRVIAGFAMLLVAVLLLLTLQYSSPFLLGVCIAAFVILIPLAFVVISAAFFAALGVVRFEESAGVALRNAINLVMKNWLVVIETAALVTVLDVVFLLGIVFLLTVVTVPFFILFLVTASFQAAFASLALTAILFLIVIFLLVASLSAVVTFHYAVWALLAERLHKGKAVAKVLRVAETVRAALSSARA